MSVPVVAVIGAGYAGLACGVVDPVDREPEAAGPVLKVESEQDGVRAGDRPHRQALRSMAPAHTST